MRKKLHERNVAYRIQLMLREKGLTVAEFAKKAGMSEQTLKNILNGSNNPQFKTAVKIADAFKVSLDWLCSEVEEEEV